MRTSVIGIVTIECTASTAGGVVDALLFAACSFLFSAASDPTSAPLAEQIMINEK
jgi:hypothetical protein